MQAEQHPRGAASAVRDLDSPNEPGRSPAQALEDPDALPMSPLQAMMSDRCVRAADEDCTWLTVWEKKDHANFIRTNASAGAPEATWLRLARLYWNATFCLQPPGDAVSRKGVLDALVLGCIPVLFHVRLDAPQ